MINININNKSNEIIGTKEEIENEVSGLIEVLIRSGMFTDSEIVTSVCCGFFACNKEEVFVKIATLLNGFDFSKLERIKSNLEVSTTIFDEEGE